MGTRIKRRKRIGKILALLLASCSLLGISPLTATAAPGGTPFDTTVVVTDSTPEECVPIPDPATWSPALFTPASIDLDLALTPSLTQTVTVDLGFMSGVDSCVGGGIPPTGTVLSVWSSSTLLLVEGSLSCQAPASCLPEEFAPAGAGGQVTGQYTVPGTIGSYSGTLTITWTP